jgi:hypothetical protein
MGEEPHGHLRTARVVVAQEQHGGLAVGGLCHRRWKGAEPLAGGTFSQERQEFWRRWPDREPVVAGVQEAFDGLHAERVGELGVHRIAAVLGAGF